HLAPRPEEELYLLESDPWELDNRAEDPQCATLRQEMAARLVEHLQRSDDPVLSGAVPPPEPPLNPRAAPNA
ncbi:MAG: hypothetical protein ACOYXW_06680, partial [Actinomycetota bacterium]